MQLNRTGPPSRPQLISIFSLQNTISKNRYVIYYQILTQDCNYKPIEQMKELLINNQKLKFKILDLEQLSQKHIIKQAGFEINDNGSVKLEMKFAEGEIRIKGNVINQSSSDQIVFSMHVNQISGYANFLKFREKYRVLENITRKRQFTLDHRLKIIDGASIFYFSLEQSDHSHYYFLNRKITLQIQQIYLVQDWQSIEAIYEQTLNLTQINYSVKSTINILQKLKIQLNVQMINNANLANFQMANLRILETNKQIGQIIIGTDKQKSIAKCLPVVQNKFYDYQFSYLSQNLKSEPEAIYKNITKLSPAFPKYHHIKNSKLLNLSNAKFLIFSFFHDNKQQTIKIPFVYLLQGFNIIQNQDYAIKFYLEFSGNFGVYEQMSADCRRLFQLRIEDIWNLGQISRKFKQFKIKIISQGITYCIPFTSTQIQKSTFRKQAKSLQLHTQYSQFLLQQQKYFIITPTQLPNKLLLTKTQSILPFYLFDLYCSSVITFQIITQNEIILQGYVSRQKIVKLFGKQNNQCLSEKLNVLLASSDDLQKVMLVFSCIEIKQKNQSLRTYYKFHYKLEYTDNIPSSNMHYSLQLQQLTTKKYLKTEIYPQLSDDGISTLNKMEDGFIQQTQQDIQLHVQIRKMYYNQETQIFDNNQILNKKIIVNSTAQQIGQKGTLFTIIKQQGYNTLQFDMYDDNIKKRLKFSLQILMRKSPQLDISHANYCIKIPQYLWKINQSIFNIKQPIILKPLLSTRKDKVQKITIFNDSIQQYTFPMHNYKDSLSFCVDGQIGYDKIIDLIKIRCDVTNKQIGWIQDSQWFLGLVNVGNRVLYFMIKLVFDANYGNRDENSGGSEKSARTQGKKMSQRSYSEKIDPLAKTVRNMELLKLKEYRNNLAEQGRHLTTKYVKNQQSIINYTKKLAQIQQKISKQSSLQQTFTSQLPKKNTQNYQKLQQLYRSICQCGQKNPKFNGYCQSCLKSLKNRYQIYLKQYKQKCYEYQRIQFNKFNKKQKYVKIKNKLKQYKQHIKRGQDIQDNSIANIIKNGENNEIKRQIQNMKIQIFRIEEQKNKLQSNAKIRLDKIEEMIRKEDKEIWETSNQTHRLQEQLKGLKNHIKILEEKSKYTQV